MKKHKRKWLWICTLTAVVLVWYGGIGLLDVNTVEIRSDKISNQITIVQLTDLHGASFGKENSRLISKIKNANPDLVVVTGDMYTHGDADGMQTATNLLGTLAKNYPVYFVNGEHDNNSGYLQQLEAAGVHVMAYQSETVAIGDTELCIYGINNVYYTNNFDLANAFELDPNHFNILLAHIQNFKKFSDLGMDLSLCGDTHGGQVRLPFVGAVYTGDAWFPDLSGEYIKGLYNQGESHLFVSSGLGNYPVPLRLFNQPEVAVIKLLPKEEP